MNREKGVRRLLTIQMEISPSLREDLSYLSTFHHIQGVARFSRLQHTHTSVLKQQTRYTDGFL